MFGLYFLPLYAIGRYLIRFPNTLANRRGLSDQAGCQAPVRQVPHGHSHVWAGVTIASRYRSPNNYVTFFVYTSIYRVC